MELSLLEFACLILCLLAIIKSANKPTLTILITNSIVQRSILAISLVLFGLWSAKAGLFKGLDIHLLALTSVTLILGPRLAILTATLTLLLQLGFGQLELSRFASTALTTAIAPILLSYGIFLLAFHYLPRHLFVYVFVNAFLAAGITIVFHIFLVTAYVLYQGDFSVNDVFDNYTILASLMWFPESTINGMLITVLIVYRPHWVRTFYDKQYLDK